MAPVWLQKGSRLYNYESHLLLLELSAQTRGPVFLGFTGLVSAPTSDIYRICSSAPQDVTSFIIPLHATQLRSAWVFGYNQAFKPIPWWRSQTLEQTEDPWLALRDRRFEEADTLDCEHLSFYACKAIPTKRLCEVLSVMLRDLCIIFAYSISVKV